MPALLILTLSTLIASLALAIRSSGWKKWLAWADFALLALPWLVAGAGGWILSASGLAWRSCVKLPCGLAFVAGILGLLLWAAISLAQRAEARQSLVGTLGSCVIMLAACLLCVAVGWYGLLFTGIWSGEDREVVVKGERMVEEHVWMDSDFYAYHGPLTRGSQRLYSSCELSREDFGEVEE